MDWYQAREFCAWAGGRLPSEAEWEYAAGSGPEDWTHPWGHPPATCARAVMDDGHGIGCGKGRMWPVCSRPAGNSAQGICDLAGNLYEWTEDCFHKTYHGAPTDGTAWVTDCLKDFRVMRGGSWYSVAGHLRATDRLNHSMTFRYDSIGFRCARDLP